MQSAKFLQLIMCSTKAIYLQHIGYPTETKNLQYVRIRHSEIVIARHEMKYSHISINSKYQYKHNKMSLTKQWELKIPRGLCDNCLSHM